MGHLLNDIKKASFTRAHTDCTFLPKKNAEKPCGSVAQLVRAHP